MTHPRPALAFAFCKCRLPGCSVERAVTPRCNLTDQLKRKRTAVWAMEEDRCPGFVKAGSAYTGGVMRAIFSAVWFWWRGCKGYRLRPWRSPYLRWRMETYSGKPAGTLRLKDFWALAVAERGQIGTYLRWVGELRGLAQERD